MDIVSILFCGIFCPILFGVISNFVYSCIVRIIKKLKLRHKNNRHS